MRDARLAAWAAGSALTLALAVGCGLQSGSPSVQTSSESTPDSTGPQTQGNGCSGLTPPAAPPTRAISYVTPLSDAPQCLSALPDGTGHVLATVIEAGGAVDRNYFVSPDGTQVAVLSLGVPAVAPQAQGFIGLWTLPTTEALLSVGSTGALVGSLTGSFSGASVTRDPNGGLLLLSPADGQLEDYDAALKSRWTFPLPTALFNISAVGMDGQGRTLILMDGTSIYGPNTLAGQWLDEKGVAGSTFEAWDSVPTNGSLAPGFELVPQVGSGLFLRVITDARQSQWVRAFASGGAGSAAPAWLASRPNTVLRLAYGGKAYAVIPDSAGQQVDTCTESVEILGPDGTGCGSTRFDLDTRTCTLGALELGIDGTVVQQIPQDFESCLSTDGGAGRCTCAWQWWPQLFGKP